MAIATHSTYTVYKRIANLILILIGIAVGANLWWVNKNQTTQFYQVQAEQLGRSLSQQKALDLANHVASDNDAQLQLALHQLVTDPHVVSAVVYDFRGRVMAQEGVSGGFFEDFTNRQKAPLTFVADISRPADMGFAEAVNDEPEQQLQVIGYLQIQLDAQQVMAHHTTYQKQLNQQRIVFMVMAALVALYITRAFYKLRFRFHRQLRAKQRLGKQR
ncbi:AhpA/YtjB family protein [Alteromonas flava]|uniref:AhpA/YtjB family protein n=1 Tax=Alteromonas flava TaxID=2048003 RepID=UPI0013D9C756|nr:AhpA/YtjB family protein [Alteromonas flava]